MTQNKKVDYNHDIQCWAGSRSDPYRDREKDRMRINRGSGSKKKVSVPITDGIVFVTDIY